LANLLFKSIRKISGPFISLVTLVLCLVAAELFLEFFAPVPDPYASYKLIEHNNYINLDHVFNKRVRTQAEEGMPGVQGINYFTTNNFGFRGGYLVRPKPANEYRIFMIDGSTLECFFLDDSQSIDAVLENGLRKYASGGLVVRAYNASKSGARLDDNISLLVHRIVHLKPDMIILLSGINELFGSIGGQDYLHRVKDKTNISSGVLLKMLLCEFQIPRRIYYLAKRQLPKTDKQILEEIPMEFNLKERVALCALVPATDTCPRVDLESYRNNLKVIIGIGRVFGIKLIFLTQPSTWNSQIDPMAKKYHWMLYNYHSRLKYREDFMDQALGQYNDAMRQIARQYSVPLYDLARIMPKSLEYFYDDCHFNVKGAEIAGEGLNSFLHKNNLLPQEK